jgi:hypothetical protein
MPLCHGGFVSRFINKLWRRRKVALLLEAFKGLRILGPKEAPSRYVKSLILIILPFFKRCKHLKNQACTLGSVSDEPRGNFMFNEKLDMEVPHQ